MFRPAFWSLNSCLSTSKAERGIKAVHWMVTGWFLGWIFNSGTFNWTLCDHICGAELMSGYRKTAQEEIHYQVEPTRLFFFTLLHKELFLFQSFATSEPLCDRLFLRITCFGFNFFSWYFFSYKPRVVQQTDGSLLTAFIFIFDTSVSYSSWYVCKENHFINLFSDLF